MERSGGRLFQGSPRRFAAVAILAILLSLVAGVLVPAGRVAAAPRVLTGTIGKAEYRIQVPEKWNGTLVLYSHGYVAPGQPNPAREVSDPVTGAALLAQGYALAGSSYSTTGWALEQGFGDQIALLDFFTQQIGVPKRTIAWGDSLGGIITAGLVQRNPQRFTAALPMCGVLMGGVGTWNGALDAQYAFKTLLAPNDPALQIVRITDPTANLQRALGLLSAAQGTPEGRARVALAGAMNQTPDWYNPTAPRPARTDYAAREAAMAAWFQNPDFAFTFALRAELEARAGGNPSFNTGVSYRELFNRSSQRDLVEALYREAGLDLGADLAAIEDAPRIGADQGAVDYLRRYIAFDGRIGIPVLTLHTVGDGLVLVEGEQAYADVVRSAGNERLLRQTYVNRAGHCTFTPAERLAAFAQLVKRVDSGAWDEAALAPAALNTAATALGPTANVLLQANGVATPPAFLQYTPAPFLRPFDARSPDPAPAPAPTPMPGLPNTGAGGSRGGADRGAIGGLALVGGLGLAARRRARRRAA